MRKKKGYTLNEEEPVYPDTYCGNLASSLFTEEGRKQQDDESNQIKNQSFSQINQISESSPKEDPDKNIASEEF